MHSRRARLRTVAEFLGSMSLAVSLLMALAVASVIGTVLRQNRAYAEYLIDFGPFWFEVFRALGLYDVYSAGWFLAILAFLLVSTAVCLVRNTPAMLRELRAWRTNVTYKSLRYGRHSRRWRVAATPAETAAALRTGLDRAGYGSRQQDGPDHVLLAARRGRWNRLGYVLTHAAIVVIAFGGLLDSRLGIKVADLAGALTVETRNLRASQIPDESRLPVWTPAFRGNVQVPEGTATDVAFVSLRDGFLVQPLPFTLELTDFRIERYPTGQPRSYESDVLVHDPELDEPLEATVAVNEPLRHRGYSVYQSSFDDGGSKLEITALPLNGHGETVELTGRVNRQAEFAPADELRIEYEDFNLFNVNRVPDGSGDGFEQRDFGPSFDYRLRTPAGDTREYRNYMLPVRRDGGDYFLSGVRDGPDEQYEYLYIPVDPDGGIDRFLALLERMGDDDRVAEIARSAVGGAVSGSELDTERGRQELTATITRLVGRFREAGFDAVWSEVEQRVPEERREPVFQAYLRVLQTVMAGLYEDVLAAQGVTEPGDAEWDYFRDALTAINALADYGSDWLLRLDGFDHVQASGLQIGRAPGKGIVYFGSGMLVLGLFLMFYVDHRRLWFWLSADGEHTDILMAGRSARDTIDFRPHFEGLAETLARGTGEHNGTRSND